ncbi:nitroreductase family protein [Paenibacillaceae bacterium WGS1546]|uniref:nitroreductase family protein n=1 Tax=Cohnella sp. WGS1546 TaxID=3366810 RepID=UPI00372CFB03
MSVAAIVKNRRSIRKFEERDVPDQLIYGLLEQAANLCDRPALQAMRVIVANRKESRDRLSRSLTEAFAATKMGKLVPGQLLETMFKRFAELPGHLIVVVRDHDSAKTKDWQYAQACFFMQSLQLLAWEQGLGMFWRSEEILYTPAAFERLGIGSGERLVGLMHFGFAAKTPRPRSRTPAAKKWLHWPRI